MEDGGDPAHRADAAAKEVYALGLVRTSAVPPQQNCLPAIVDSTLAAQSQQARAACLTVAQAVRGAYARTGAEARRRWPRTGTSIGSARVIDQLATQIAEAVVRRHGQGTLGDISGPVSAVSQLRSAVARLLGLPEAPEWRFRASQPVPLAKRRVPPYSNRSEPPLPSTSYL
jgi:hypothetical protein